MNPENIPKEVHGLDCSLFDEDAIKVLKRLKDAGFAAYLVGGCVRDLILKHIPKDYDISTTARPEDVKKLFRNCILIGKRFRLAHLRFPNNKVLQVATFRKGDNETDSLIINDNVWGSAEEDVLRRDFTINGLFFDSETETIIDYVGGYKDLQATRLTTIGQPFIRFKQDPVRMMRCLKFQARFGFEIDPDTKQALIDCRKEIVKSSQARIFEEILKMLESGASQEFFKLMTQFGLLEMLMPTLALFLEGPDGSEVYSLLEEVDNLFKESPELIISRATLLSTLVFPILHKHLLTHISQKERSLHLGQIQKEAYFIIDLVFQPFFHLPKKIKATLASILTTQYRLTPLESKAPMKIRIPRTPDFHLCLDFLNLRARIEPALSIIWESWSSAYQNSPYEDDEPKHYPRKRRRRRPK